MPSIATDKPSQFPSHGTLDAEVRDRVLILHATGPWNIESLQEAGQVIEPLHQQLYGNPWAVLAILYGEPLHVPEAADLLVDIIRNEKSLGRIASAVLVNQSDSPSLGRAHVTDIYSRAGEHFAFFDDLNSAWTWLQERLADAKSGN